MCSVVFKGLDIQRQKNRSGHDIQVKYWEESKHTKCEKILTGVRMPQI